MKKALSACVAVTSVTLLDSPDDQIAAIEQAFASLDPILARYDEISMADADGKRIKVRDNRGQFACCADCQNTPTSPTVSDAALR